MKSLSFILRSRTRFVIWIIAVFCAMFARVVSASSIVYENQYEFFAAGDFNGDGILDVLTLDKATGNARVGYQGTNGSLTWSAALVTGVEGVTGLAVGHVLVPGYDDIAVTAPDFNQVSYLDLSNPNAVNSPLLIIPPGVGLHSLVALASPFGDPPSYDSVLAASSLNPPPTERLDMLLNQASLITPGPEYNGTGPFDRPNSLQLNPAGPTLAVGITRGANDSLDIWQFTNAPGVLASASNLPPGSDYAFGVFNSETLPRFLVYQPGQSNLLLYTLMADTNGLNFGAPVLFTLSNAVQNVFYLNQGAGGSFQLNFGNAIQGMRPTNGSATFSAAYSTGAGAAGSSFTGMAPLSNGVFVLLDAPAGATGSTHAQVVRFNGTNYTQLSSGNLPAITSRNTRANVWLFQSEPFVNANPGLIQSLNAPDWTVGVSGLPGSISAMTETDGGPSSGLGITPGTTNLGTPPAGAAFAIPNQYRDVISIFSYATPRPPDAVNVTISPAPGSYTGPIQVSFATLNAGDQVFYHTNATDAWHPYGGQFTLTYSGTVQYYGTNDSSGLRSRLQSAVYTLHTGDAPQPPFFINTNGTTNSGVVDINTNEVILSDIGTIFYGRRSGNTGTIWCVNLDGSGETYITTGARPRVSRDGQWLAFLRDGNPFANQGNLWVRDLTTGAESLLFFNTNTIVNFDWDITGTNLIFDYNCQFYEMPVSGQPVALPLPVICHEYAPVVNPVDGRIADFLNGNSVGIDVSSADRTTRQTLPIGNLAAYWAAWSPDGKSLSFANGNPSLAADGGQDLWIMNADGTQLHQITGFANQTNGFPHGAAWSPQNDALVAAGTIYGTNGLWVIPLTENHTACDCDQQLAPLPISAGDPVDFVGSVIATPPVVITNFPTLFTSFGPSGLTVYWSTNYLDYALETTTNLPASSWTHINGPYYLSGDFFEYLQAETNSQQYFRLRLTGAMVVSPGP